MANQQNSGQFLGGLVLGGVIGAIAGLLVAPRTGKETRKIIKKSAEALPEIAEDLGTSLQLHAGHFSEITRQNWAGTLERLQQAIAAGVEASQTATVATDLDFDNPDPKTPTS